jgi:hypothetical protein
MKDNLDVISAFAGACAALLKGIKHRLNMRQIAISLIIASILAWGTIGILQYFFASTDPKITILVSFSVGWVANELTDILDEFVKEKVPVILENLFKIKPKNKGDNEKGG